MNKYQYLWVVQGYYGYGWEDLTCSDIWLEAKTNLKDYRENESVPFRVIQRRILNNQG